MPQKPQYRVLYNFDCSDLFRNSTESLTAAHVERMVEEVAHGADVILINPNAQNVNYPSKVWQTYWDGYREGDRNFFGSIPDSTLPARERMVSQMAQLAEQCDYLATALAHSRQQSMTPGISMRMNDMHDIPWPDSHYFSRFYKDNPQLHLPPINARDWGAEGFNYEHAEVREYFLSLIREFVDDYDFDVLELDFSRFTYYFDRGDSERHCAIMTAFIAEVRNCLAKADRHIHLIPRIAADPDAAYALGFDVEAWARDNIVDGIVVTSMITTAWTMPIDKFRSLVGPDIAIYGAAEVTADKRDGIPLRYLPGSCEMLRGFAAGYYAAGADGVELFNYFLQRKAKPVASAEEFFGRLREMRSLEEIRAKPRLHLLGAGYWTAEFDLPDQVPVTIAKHSERRFEILLAAVPEPLNVEVHVCFDGGNTAADLWLRIGRYSAQAADVGPGPEGDQNDPGRAWLYDNDQQPSYRQSKVALFHVPADVIRDGRNDVIVRSENMSVTILGIDVEVSSDNGIQDV